MEESSRGETPADIKTRLQKQRPKNFKGHSIGCSDVIVITDDGKTTSYYVNKDGFIIIPEFLTIKSSSNTRLSIDTRAFYGNHKNHAASCRQGPHRKSGDQ